MCEWTYFIAQNEAAALGRDALFIHVPPVGKPYSLEQLSYSDGLSTLSLFVQEGSLPADTGGTLSEIGGSLVHVTSSAPDSSR